jgi:hypothetical protein
MALSTINASTGLTDGTVTSVKLADFAAAVDLNGVELILDADQDTSITADTDDRIDFKIAGVEHFSFSNSSGDTIIKPMVDAKDIIFQQYDGNILLTIDDAGFVGIHNSAAGPGVIRIYEDTDLGSHYSGFTVGNLTASVSYVLPAADGSSGEQLTTNGSGVLSWATGGVSLANDANNRVVTGTGSGLNGEANLTFDGSALQLTGTLTVGVDDTGYDVKLFGATSGKSLLWDESADSLIVTGTTTLVGTTNLDAVDIDGAVQLDSTLTVGVNDTGYDVKFFGATAGKSLLWDESADTLIVTGNATISGTATTTGVHTFTAIPLLPDNTVSTADIQADAITNAKIADDQIDSEHYVDGSIDTAHIADSQVTLAKTTGLVGKQTIWVPAQAMTATTSNGCSVLTTVETTSGRPDMNVLDFDKDSDEFAQFSVAFPKAWNAGTITFQFFWSGIAATTGVAMSLQGVSFADNDSIDTAYGTAVVVQDDAQGAVEELLVSAESGAVTIAGSPGDNELCYFRVGRDVSDGNDDMAGDCRLHGIKLFFTNDALNDA